MRTRLNSFLDDLDLIIEHVTDIDNMLSFCVNKERIEDTEEMYQSIISIQLKLINELKTDINQLYKKIDDTELEVLQGRILY